VQTIFSFNLRHQLTLGRALWTNIINKDARGKYLASHTDRSQADHCKEADEDTLADTPLFTITHLGNTIGVDEENVHKFNKKLDLFDFNTDLTMKFTYHFVVVALMSACHPVSIANMTVESSDTTC
jgi:hypothetical protein